MASKIVVLGDVDGQLSQVFGKIKGLHAKQAFACAIIAGNLFSDPTLATDSEKEAISKLINGDIEVACTTYFSLGTYGLPADVVEKLERDDGELCLNLFLLGRKVSLKTADGLRVVAVGGKYRKEGDDPMSAFDATYSESDLQSLTKDQGKVDLLITNEWPASVCDGARAIYPNENGVPSGRQAISNLCASLKPRYHLSTSEGFYERQPFFHPGEAPRPVTRFISIAPFGNTDKQKWAYAFSIDAKADTPDTLPPECTASPFLSKKRKLDTQRDSFNSFRYSNGDSRTDHYEPERRRRKNHHHQPPTPQQCFFCLSNEPDTHMIVAIGEDCYVTVAKGPLTTRQTYPELGIPGHMLVIPLEHQPTISSYPDKELQKSTLAEMQRYRSALHDMLVAKTKDNSGRAKLGAVTWEISRGAGVHLHWQFLPVPVDMVNKGLVAAAFEVEAKNLEYPRFEKDAEAIADVMERDYVRVMIWSETLQTEMVMPIDQTYRLDLQFGRKVLAMLLGLENRVDWRACAQSREEETADAEAFKKLFEEFDFSR